MAEHQHRVTAGYAILFREKAAAEERIGLDCIERLPRFACGPG